MAKNINQAIKELKDLDKRLSTAGSDFYTKAVAKVQNSLKAKYGNDVALKHFDIYTAETNRVFEEKVSVEAAAAEARQWVSTVITKMQGLSNKSSDQISSINAASKLESGNKWADSAIKNRIKSNYSSIKKNIKNLNNTK